MDLIPKTSCFQIPSYILNDLCTRFIINIPGVESRDIVRVFFQIELAHWFYLDFYLPENADLRSVNLKDFAAQMFVFCPTLSAHCKNFDAIFESWKEYKQSVPTYGAILLDPTLQHCLLVQGFFVKASWGFPKGKVNQDERPVDCAIREVLEETGFDIRDLIDENRFLENRFNDQISRLYIVPGVPQDTPFQAKTRQEIKDFNWFRVDYLPVHKKDNICKQHYGLGPNAFFMVIPFIKELKVFISHALAKQLSLPSLGKGQQRFGPQPAAKTPMDIKPLSEKKRQKQQQQFTQQMNQQLQDLVFHQETPSQFPYSGAQATKSVSPRQAKWFSQMNKPGSPVKKSAIKQLQILKRDGTLTQRATGEIPIQGPLPDNHSEDVDLFDFSCHFWTNFRLDVDQVLEAMLQPKCN